MRYDRWYRPLASVLGAGPKWTAIRVAGGELRIQHGWMFRLDVPLTEIESARAIPDRPFTWGVHRAPDGWLVNGSRSGIVQIRFIHPVRPKRPPLGASLGPAGLNGAANAVYISVTDPEGFVAALST